MAVVAGSEVETTAVPDLPARAAARFPCFDGLRALAALAVFGYHSAAVLRAEDPAFLPNAVQSWLSLFGIFGVAVFFVISGFLLYRPFSLAMLEGRPAPTLAGFWKRRFFRIFPAYWVALAAAVFVLDQMKVVSVGNVLTTFGLLQNFRVADSALGLGVAWTLSIEVAFYLFLPLFAWVVGAVSRPLRARSNLTVQLIALATLAAFAVAFRQWFLIHTGPNTSTPGTWFALPTVRYWMPIYLDWFAFGMAMAAGSAWLSTGGRIPRIVAAFGRFPALSWLLAAECCWVVVQTHMSLFGAAPAPSPGQDAIWLLAAGACAAFLVLPAVFGDQDAGLIRRLLRTRALVALGVISYGFYLWHLPIWIQLTAWLPHGVPMVVQVAIAFTATVLVATLSWEVIERPIIRWATGTAPVSLWRGHTVAPVPDRPAAVRSRAPLVVAGLVVTVAVVGLLVGSTDLTRRNAVGSPDDYRWRAGRATVWDNFARPDQTGLGAATTGQRWDPVSGTWSIAGGNAVVDGGGFAILRTPLSHLRTVGSGLAFRCRDARNCWWIDPAPSFFTWNLHMVKDGRVTYLGNIGSVPTGPNAVLTVHIEKSRVLIAVDGVVRRVITRPDLHDAVGVGLARGSAQGSERWRSFEADR